MTERASLSFESWCKPSYTEARRPYFHSHPQCNDVYMQILTHFQGFLFNADHHLGVFTLHAVSNVKGIVMVFIIYIFPGTIVEGGGEINRWREWKGQARASVGGSLSRTRLGVSKDGEIWRKHALCWVHYNWVTQLFDQILAIYILFKLNADSTRFLFLSCSWT